LDTILDPGAGTSAAMTVKVTREELYELVWTVPMQRLAERYGISDVALAKSCRKLLIPVPPRGYWRRKETGRVPARPPLPRPRPGSRATVTLSLERKREPPPPSPELAARAAHEALPENRILVADRLSRPHPLVREAAAVLRPRSRRVDSVRPWRIDRCLDIRVTPKHLGRALRIFDALIKALDARGIQVSVVTDDRRRHTQVELYGETVAFWLEERTAPHPHVPTEAENKEGSAGRRKWDHVPSGQLRLRIENPFLESARKTWSDGHRAKLEDLLNDFVGGLAVVADGLRARTVRWKHQREEEEQRVRTLEQQVDRWTRAAQVRAFADEAERRASAKGVPVTPASELGEWLAWARRHADRLDPFKPPSASTG